MQMDLFAAKVISFPVDRQLAIIRKTARVLESLKGEPGDEYWLKTCLDLKDQWRRLGLPECEIQPELARFAHAVHAELQRAAWAEWEEQNPSRA